MPGWPCSAFYRIRQAADQNRGPMCAGGGVSPRQVTPSMFLDFSCSAGLGVISVLTFSQWKVTFSTLSFACCPFISFASCLFEVLAYFLIDYFVFFY